MIASIEIDKKTYTIDLSKPIDISIPLIGNKKNINAWYVDPPKITPHKDDAFVGSVKKGSSTNFNDIFFNPHAHVTHTECLGHITEEVHSINQKLSQFFFLTQLISLTPQKVEGDLVITRDQLSDSLGKQPPEAIVIRTLPNGDEKLTKQYSHTNPPYISVEGIRFLVEKGVKHLLVDLPSIDKEKDGGDLLGHNAFWGLDDELRPEATITEFVYVDSSIRDAIYFMNLQLAPIENDASPSRPVLFQLL